MKKKLALLLAFAMMLSALPMNLFGAAGEYNYPPRNQTGSYAGASNYEYQAHMQNWGGINADANIIKKLIHEPQIAVDLGLNYGNAKAVAFGVSGASIKMDVVLSDAEFAAYFSSAVDSNKPSSGDPSYSADNSWLAGSRDGEWWLEWNDAGSVNQFRYNASYVGMTDGRFLDVNGLSVDETVSSFTYRLTVLGSNLAELEITSSDTNFTTANLVASGVRYALIPTLRFTQLNDAVPIKVSFGGYNIPNITTPPVVRRGLSVGVANPTVGENYLYFDRLNIAENAPMAFSNGDVGSSSGDGAAYAIVTLYAPNDFKWVSPPNNQGMTYVNALNSSISLTSPGNNYAYATKYQDAYVQLSSAARYTLHPDQNGVTNKYLSIRLPMQKNISRAINETISLAGVGLVADNRAAYDNVTVKYAVDWVETPYSGSGHNQGYPSNHYFGSGGTGGVSTFDDLVASSIEGDWSSSNDRVPGQTRKWARPLVTSNGWLWQDINVGTRGWTEAGFGLKDNAEPTTIRSGDQGADFYNGDNGAWTQTMRLQENAVGAWGSGLGFDVTFKTPDHGGAVILGAKIYVPSGDKNYEIVKDGSSVYYGLSTNNATAQNNRDEFGLWNYRDSKGVLITPEYVSYKPPMQNWSERSMLRYIDISLQLSVEPGYADKWGEEITITAEGPALAHLYGDNEVVAAYARDPITVEVETSGLTISDNNTYNVAVEEISDIVITETDYGMLPKGSDIWVYVTGARANEVEFTADMVAETNYEASGLKLSRGAVLRHRWSNSWVNGIRYVVEERSHERASRDATDVGQIIIPGGKITGPVYPGVAYDVVISGTAVAANDYTVYENRGSSNTSSSFDNARNINWRLFDRAAPYSAPAFEYDVEASTPPPVDNITPPATVSQSLTINEWSPEVNGVKPFVMVQVDGSTAVGMVSPRVLAEFFGGAANWDDDTRTATITGTHKDGSAVEVTLQNAATSGTINGQTYDIATYSGSAAPGTVSVYTSATNNFYVPMRFLTSAFGYTIDWNPASRTATIRN